MIAGGNVDNKVNLLDFTVDELKEYIKGMGLPAYRAGQIRKNLYRGTDAFDGMTDLSLAMREELNEKAVTGYLKVIRKIRSNVDGTCKYLFDLGDGNVIESVLMKYKYGYSACISSQAGCRMGCTFCASAGILFDRNLSSGEMIAQVLSMQKDGHIKVGHIVIMGIGEPLDNFDNVIKFLKEAGSEDGLNISYRKISLSTCGIVPGINKLAEYDFPITLSVSLHSPFNVQRSSMMPVNRKYPLEELIASCKQYIEKTSRRMTFEYAMISGVNDTAEHAKELSGLIKGMLCHVNLIPVNKIQNNRYDRSSRESIDRFQDIVSKKGISVTVRRELGPDIEAACGQLRRTNV